MTRERLLQAVGGDDKFPAYAWPGGYAILYMADDGEVICADCVNGERNIHFGGLADGWRIDGWQTSEGSESDEVCANCNSLLHKAE